MTDMKNPSVLIAECESALKDRFAALEAREERLTARVLDLFAEEQVALRHFNPTNGYGYDDQGRDTLERLYAKLFRTEAAIVRPRRAPTPCPCACSACSGPATTC